MTRIEITDAVEDASNISRRRAIGWSAASIGLSLVAGAKALAQTPAGPPSRTTATDVRAILATDIRATLQLLAPGVWAFIQKEAPGQSNVSVSNCGVIAGPRGLLAIDATAAPAHAKRFRAMAERATGKTFDRVVITHWHGDHHCGVQFLGDGIDVVAQEECAAAISRSSTARPIFWDARNPAWSDGSETYRRATFSTTYSERMTLSGYTPKQVQFFWPNRAHTNGDTCIYLPDEKVVFIGDIGFFDVTPMNGSGYIANWIKVCNDILAMDVTAIVPGHGPVGGKDQLEDMKQYLVLLYAETKKRFDQGLTPGRAAAEIDLGKYANWPDSNRIVNNVTRLYAEFNGTLAASTPQPTVAAAREEYDRLKGL